MRDMPNSVIQALTKGKLETEAESVDLETAEGRRVATERIIADFRRFTDVQVVRKDK
jgi:hypothetical protein